MARCGLTLALVVSVACTGEVGDEAPRSSTFLTMNGAIAGCVPGALAGACAPAPACTDGVCACAPGLSACGGACVDLLSDAINCGGCGNTCPAGTACAGGQCSCPVGTSACNGVCSITQADLLNCGGCGIACVAGEVCDAGRCVAGDSPTCSSLCGGGRICVAGACTCPDGQSDCNGTCADTQTDSQSCGACDHACNPGETCVAGSCTCPAGQTACGETCVDTQTSLEHCGGCDQACFEGESCTAGACRGAAGADGCSGSARMISLREIAVYQSIKVPVMENLSAVASSARITDVVTGRETLFRVFVTPMAGFAPRELSARLTLVNGASQDQYFAKQLVSGESTDASSASTFMIFVPPDKIQADTRYALELVECGSDPGTGSMVAPRFPASGDEALDARDTGSLKIAIVPVQVDSMLPDTSTAALDLYREYFMAMYPISSIELSVTSSVTTPSPINWNNLLEQIRQKRQSDAPAGDVYYYGFVKPAATFRDYCRTSCTAGVGYVTSSSQSSTRAAVGLAFADEMSASTMAHEVGHNHGRNHAPCAPGGQISGVDNNYPHSGATLGSWGYDARSRLLIDPDEATDIMGYCNMKWVSDYTYDALVNRVATINANYDLVVTQAALASYRVLLLDEAGPRWSYPITQPSEAFGEPLAADALAADGSVAAQITVFRTAIGDSLGSFIVLVPEPAASWAALRIPGWPAISFAAALGLPAP